MSTSHSITKGRYYAVDFDSSLGVQIRNHLTRCTNCEQSIRDFLRSVEQKYSFPLPVTDDTVYCMSDDCEAGGLLAILVPKSAYDAAHHDARSEALWCTAPSPDDDGMLYVFPRVETQTHYIRYGQAVSLFESNAIDWRFVLPNAKDKSKNLKLHVVTYGEVRNRLTKSDRDALNGKSGKTPSPAMRLAIGRQYVLRDDEDVVYTKSEYLADAIELHNAWMSLPAVPANTLARVLGLKALTDKQVKDPDYCFCNWSIDTEHHRYIIHTGLHSDILTDEISVPSQS